MVKALTEDTGDEVDIDPGTAQSLCQTRAIKKTKSTKQAGSDPGDIIRVAE